jgi:phasin family protein
MFSFQEQLSAATKAHLEAQIAMMNTLTHKAFENMEKVIQLNVTAAKASFEESSAAIKQLVSAKDAQEFFSLATAQAQPNTEKTLAYSRHLASIASGAQADFTKIAEAQISETSNQVIALVDEVSKNAPAGSESAIAMLKSSIGNASAGYAQLTKTSKQAADTLETNMSHVANQFSQAAEKNIHRATKK